jgi:LPXTG-motif cell wall-anchored protein
MRAPKSGILAGVIVLVAALVGALPAAAATTTAWAAWQPLTGTGGAYTTTVQVAAQPALTATMTSDSRAGQVGVISGASTWLSQGTPVGEKYGSSINQQYLNLRPKADSPTSPSTTTYSFATPTPASGWAFVLGDIDADSVRVEAIGVDGQTLTAEEIGFNGGFNYCAPGVAGKPSCSGDAADVPAWDATTQTLTGNATASDTSGSAAWFEPSVPITSLTFFFTQRSGFPIYQTWFASIARDITGTVADQAEGPLPGATLTLTDANGTVVGTTTTDADGTYSFPGFIATDGYTVTVTVPDGKIVVGPTTQAVDLTTEDGRAAFEVRDAEPVGVTVSGRVVDDEDTGVPGAIVTIDGVDPATTDADGGFLIEGVPAGPHAVEVTPPPGFSATEPTEIVVPEDSEEPIVLEDLVVVENPDLSGTVRVDGTDVAGVTITASDGVDTVTAVTDEDGAYTFPRLPAGEYEITMTTPDGYVASGPATRTENLTTTDLGNVDFELARLGSISGEVRTDDGAPVAGVIITVESDEVSHELTTDADGGYVIADLPPDSYDLTITAPEGRTIIGPTTVTFVITAAGESFVGQNFTISAAAVTPTDPPTQNPTDPASPPDTGGGQLPATGLGSETFIWAAAGAAVLVIGGVLFLISRRRSRRD